MKQLKQLSKRVNITLLEEFEGKQITYNYDTTEVVPTPTLVVFSVQGADGVAITGSYSPVGGFQLNGQGIAQAEDLKVVQTAFITMQAIINNTVEVVTSSQDDEG